MEGRITGNPLLQREWYYYTPFELLRILTAGYVPLQNPPFKQLKTNDDETV